MGDIEDAIGEAVLALKRATGKSAQALFNDRHLDEPGVLPSADAQRAAGIIEGAAVALGLTVNELLDELGLDDEQEA